VRIPFKLPFNGVEVAPQLASVILPFPAQT
jgi:hypothetical protein